MLFPFKKIGELFMACSLGYLRFVVDAHAETMSMQEALVELTEAVQVYQVGDRPQALQTLLSHYNRPNISSNHSTRGSYLHRRDLVGRGECRRSTQLFSRSIGNQPQLQY